MLQRPLPWPPLSLSEGRQLQRLNNLSDLVLSYAVRPLLRPPVLHHHSNCSRDRGLRAFLEAAGAVVVLFCLSWRLAPAVSVVIVVTAVAAAMYRRSTRPVEAAQSAALQRMAGVAYQAFQNMRTVRSFAGA